jgi:hypothetical protein
MNRPIDVRQDLSAEEFVSRYVVGNQPVIVTDAVERWPASRRWDLHYLGHLFGDGPLAVADDGAEPVGTMRFTELVDHLDASSRDEGPADGSISHLRYLRARDRWIFERSKADWARPYFMPSRWYCVPLALRDWDPSRNLCPGFNLYISPRGAASKLHVDGMRTNSVLCQIRGRKRCFLISPDQEALLPDRAERRRRRARRLTRQPPDFGRARVLAFDLHPGEILLFPRSWFHEVHTLETSVSLSWNFVHGSEARGFYPWYLKALLANRELLNVG